MAALPITRTLAHPTQFMIDLETTRGEPGEMQKFIERESDYDLAFCKAWEVVDRVKEELLTTPTKILNVLDQIQACALSHLPEKETAELNGRPIYRMIQGRSTKENYYGLSKNANSNEEGIREIIRKIWINKASFTLVTTDLHTGGEYFLNRSEFCIFYTILTPKGLTRIKKELLKNDDSNTKTIQSIFRILIQLYNQPSSSDSMKIWHYDDYTEAIKERKALQILTTYFEQIKTDDAIRKIETISVTIQNLMQLHLYCDGNGRSLYMLANLLLHQNGLRLFYPRNMCMFDGNSVRKMVKEVKMGQERFTLSFRSFLDLTTGLKDYSTAVQELVIKIGKDDFRCFQKFVNARKFNELLRQSAAREKHKELLKFLLDQASKLNIDIFSQGIKSGNALDVTHQYENTEGVTLLRSHGLRTGAWEILQKIGIPESCNDLIDLYRN